MTMGPFRQSGGSKYIGGEPRQIGLILCDRFPLADTAIVVEAFHAMNASMDRHGAPAVRYNVRLLSAAGGRITSTSSVCVWTDSIESCDTAESFRAIIFCGGRGIHDSLRSERFVDWLHRVQESCKLFLTIGESSVVLTHLASLKHGIPPVRPGDPSYPKAQPLATSAESAISAAVAVIELDHNDMIAAQIARSIDPEFGSGLREDIRRGGALTLSQPIQDAARWICANADREISLDEVAKIAAMSGRNFLRRFRLEVGMKPSVYLLKVRLDMACRLLAQTRLPVDKIARRCGINGGGRLSKLFRKQLHLTPTEYRARHSDIEDDRERSDGANRLSIATFLVSANSDKFPGVGDAAGE
ncbi:helix-turn-helix domain-containing protein [Paraburkholderia sp. JHI869]|uniref:GlxA family transcriptional regulator n=1 Tax=Paraburkholderia sp. JHI869 TaxID=3112959 RepID=UPI0031760B78